MSPSDFEQTIREIAADHASGATTLVLQGIEALLTVDIDRQQLERAAWRLCFAQPSMAAFRTVIAIVLGADDPAGELRGLRERIRRAPAAIARLAAPVIGLRRSDVEPLHLVTCSRSAAVEETAKELARLGRVRVSCAESRPAREGVALAEALTAAGVSVELFSDAAIWTALQSADAFVTGADALASEGFVNKVGTSALAALARALGVATFVLAGREKILPDDVFRTLDFPERPADEIASTALCTVRNPCFELIPADLSGQIITDGGVVQPAEVRGARPWTADAVAEYMSVFRSYNMLDSN